MELYYIPKLASVGQQLDPTCQEPGWIKQHAQWLCDKKKAFKVASPLGLMCSIEAMEECIARKSQPQSGTFGPSTIGYADDGRFSVPPVAARDDYAGGGCATTRVHRQGSI